MAKAEQYALLWAIYEDKSLSAAAKVAATALLLKFRNHATGQCKPSFNAIAKVTGRTRRPTQEALLELKQYGWLDWTGTNGGSPKNTNGFLFKLTHAADNTGAARDTSATERTTGAADSTPTHAADSPRTILTIKNQQKDLQLKKQEKGKVLVEADGPEGDKWRAFWRVQGMSEPICIDHGRYYQLPSEHPPCTPCGQESRQTMRTG